MRTLFGQWLKQRRRALDLTQEELAERVGCSWETIRKIEDGLRRPSKQIAELLAGCFDIAPDERTAFVSFARGRGADRVSGESVLPVGDGVAPWRAIYWSHTNLPVPVTSFVGREQEVARLRELLMGGGTRLLTLTGSPGIGKTRLSLQAGTELLASVADGVWLVELAPLVDPGLVPQDVARVLGVREEADRPLLASLIDHLRERELLLILDNCEHLVAACARLADSLLRACPGLLILASSRELLNVQGERNFPVPPLALPDASWFLGPTYPQGNPQFRPRSSFSLAGAGHMPVLTRYEAVRLFIERAQAARADFQVTDDTAPAVAEICMRLDGLPLAIELAAARIRLFPPQALLARLSRRLKLLTGGARGLPARQQTLRGAIEWSYHLLNEGEQQLFRRMAIFQGGRTLEALEAVCGGGWGSNSSPTLSPIP